VVYLALALALAVEAWREVLFVPLALLCEFNLILFNSAGERFRYGIRRPSVETARSNREPFQLPKSLRSRAHKALLAVLVASRREASSWRCSARLITKGIE
jgi:hypothetical protein